MPPKDRFLWFRDAAPDRAFRTVPDAGFCISAFVFLHRGPAVLLGRYAGHPSWSELTGLDPDRIRTYAEGWTIPASHVKLGEHPRDAARRILEDVLELASDDVEISGPRVETSYGPHPKFPEAGKHFDLWFFFEGHLESDVDIETPAWFSELAWVKPDKLCPSAFSRCHEEVLEVYRERSGLPA